MTDQRLVCIRTKKEVVVRCERLPLNEAQIKVDSGDWCFISKSKYKRYLKLQNPKYTSGVFTGVNRKDRHNRNNIDTNNRKSNKGRNYKYQKFGHKYDEKGVETNYDIHKSKVYYSDPDPVTGARVKSKCGKAIVVKTVTNTLHNTESKGTTFSIKHIIYSKTKQLVDAIMFKKFRV